MPWNVAQSIRQRVAALPEPTQDMLGAAAVIGRRMERALLCSVMTHVGQDERATLLALETAGRAGLLLEEGEDAYQFSHDLILEAIVADLSAARRASLHRHVAEALEQTQGKPAVGRLAYHYQQAGQVEQALTRGRERHLWFALVDPLRVQAQRCLQLKRWADAQAALEEALVLCRAMPYPYAEAKAFAVYGQLHTLKGELDQAHERLKAALAILHRLGEQLYTA